MKIVIVADWHCGKDRVGRHKVSAERWDAPMREAVAWAVENEADAFIVAGDLFDKRNPTTAEYRRAAILLGELHRPPIIIAGNHDIGATAEAVPATWPFSHFSGAANSQDVALGRGDFFQLIALPWPRPVDYEQYEEIWNPQSLEEELALTRKAVQGVLYSLASNLDPSRPAILVGHAMAAYGEAAAQSPNLLLGKDVVLPYDYLTSLPNVGAVALGHVHQPGRGYVGSTQPTDFADVEQKSFTVIEITKWAEKTWPTDVSLLNGYHYETTQIPYETSLRAETITWDFTDATETPAREYLSWPMDFGVHEPDVVRVEVTTRHDDPLESHEVYAAIHDNHPNVAVESVTIDRPRERPSRLAEDTPSLVAVSPTEAAHTWLAQSGYDEARTKAAMDEFSKILAEVSDD